MRKLDYEDYVQLPDDNGERYEILDGELYVMVAPSPFHQRLSKRLQRRLEGHFEDRGLGEVLHSERARARAGRRQSVLEARAQ